jgi:hypothetical protein|tara:strand:- start:75 stop:740 length:666 start_codon:yes stop_codon:yes gene_type:complete
MKISGFLYGLIAILRRGYEIYFGISFDQALLVWPSAWILLILPIVIILWISVAWHRYILLKQAPRAFIPEFYFKLTLVYLQKSVLMLLVASLPMMLLYLPYWMYQDAYPYTLIGVMFFSFLFLTPFCAIILFRLTPLLSAAALGHDLGLKAAWTATRGQTLTLLFLFGPAFGVLVFLAQLNHENMLLSFLQETVLGWVGVMLWASLVTTVYGHYVEKRTLV